MNLTDDDPARLALLHSMLREQDVPCPLCAYNLRNLTSDRCPECGGALKLQVGLVEPRLGPYIALLTACCVGLGGSALFTIIGLFYAPTRWFLRLDGGVLLAQLLITAALLPAILARRARFRRLSVGLQRALAIGLCGLIALLWTVFVVFFRG
jgi:hypothetical protein